MQRKLSALALIPMGIRSAMFILVFLAFARPLAAPAEAQEVTAGEVTVIAGTSSVSAMKAGKAETRTSDASDSDDAARTPASGDTVEMAQVRETSQATERAPGPLAASAGETDVRITDTGDDDNIVNTVVVAVTGCTVEEGATVTVEDADGTRVRLIDGQNVEIAVTQDGVLIEVSDSNGNINGLPTDAIGGDENFGSTDRTVDGEVISSTGITCEKVDDDTVDNIGGGDTGDDGVGVDDNGNSGDLNCNQVLQIFRNDQNNQYLSLDGELAHQTQVCLENEVIVGSDTEGPLPPTGGPPLLALAALGLASAVVGGSVVRAALRREG